MSQQTKDDLLGFALFGGLTLFLILVNVLMTL